MSRAEPRGEPRVDERAATPFRGTLLALFAVVVALWPYTAVIAAGRWTMITATTVLAVGAVSLLGRLATRWRRPSVQTLVTLCIQLPVTAAVLTALLAPGTALLGLVPTASTVEALARRTAQAAAEIQDGVAPLADTPGIRSLTATAFAVLAVLLEHLVARHRAVLSVVLVTAVGALPMIITLGDPNVAWFVLLAVLALLLLRRAARTTDSAARIGPPLAAIGGGTVAILVTVVLVPMLPVSATPFGVGADITVDASLRLGDDLRRPNPVTVLTVATTRETAPYLRLATLSDFDGEVWRPDQADAQALVDGFGEPDWSDDVERSTVQTSIKVLGMSSDRLPVPYPAQHVTGLDAQWEAVPADRTVVSASADAAGNDYTVTSAVVAPTLEQITAAAADTLGPPPQLPEGLPPMIAETARAVTADATSDYERLIDLQNWFRSEFEYSIDTPVEDDFDGTGADAVATFLEVRSGYCIHFAGAFALMARSLGMPTRIVVGYLPGELTDDRRGDDYIYRVDSARLHAWPEVRFDGIGWVPFEPTATLGIPTAFAPAEDDSGAGEALVPSAAPTAGATAGPTIAPPEDDRSDAGAVDAAPAPDPAPILLSFLGVVVALLIPLLVRSAVRIVRMRRAARGDAAAAWAELRDTLIDLGLAPSDAQTPRERAAGLVSDRGADAAALRRLVAAIERASYARVDPRSDALAVPLHTVLRSVRAASDVRARVAARLLPRSLVTTRPSS